MEYMLRSTVTLVMVLAIFGCTSQQQSKPRSLHNAEFDWTITIPEGFESVPAEEWEKMQNKGAQAVQNTYGEKVENLSTVIFVFRKGQFNYLEANYQPFDPAIDGDYRESYKGVNEILYETFRTQMPNASLDSASSVQSVSGLEFQKFDITIGLPNGVKLKSQMYSRLFGDKDFSVNIMYADEEPGEKMTTAWLTSVFQSGN